MIDPRPTAPAGPSCPQLAPELARLRVAIVHHWFIRQGGAERVIEAMCLLFPQADIFTLVRTPQFMPAWLKNHNLTHSWVQKIPFAWRWHRFLLPLYPFALEDLDLDAYDLVISSESGPAKGVLTRAHTLHICYCNTPMRYLWEMCHAYSRQLKPAWLARPFYRICAPALRLWDVAASARVDEFIAGSHNAAGRIWKTYRRKSVIMHSPVAVLPLSAPEPPEDYYLVISRLVSYKRVDLAIKTCNALGRRLKIVGMGEEARGLKKLAGPAIEFLEHVTDDHVRRLLLRCRALLFPGEEDYGLMPIEANAAGRAVIAYGRGGARETLAGVFVGALPPPAHATAVWFQDQTAESLEAAILYFEKYMDCFQPAVMQAHASRFDTSIFLRHFHDFVLHKWRAFQEPTSSAAEA